MEYTLLVFALAILLGEFIKAVVKEPPRTTLLAIVYGLAILVIIIAAGTHALKP